MLQQHQFKPHCMSDKKESHTDSDTSWVKKSMSDVEGPGHPDEKWPTGINLNHKWMVDEKSCKVNYNIKRGKRIISVHLLDRISCIIHK